ncbi:MAG: TlpA disulfide reductase family protein [Gammaproteobacteria bacterium]|nr:TlpA disulfide reductase family protein [Gammaproteobacteria bacterium]
MAAARRAVSLSMCLLLLASTPACATGSPERIQFADADRFAQVLEAQRGRVVLVNFWATWCRPCLKEIPDLMLLEADLAERGFVLMPVSLDDPDSIDTVVIPFLDKFFPEFRSWVSLETSMDRMVSVVDPAWNEILPTSYIIDRDGKVAAMLQGGKSGAQFAAKIRPLLD